MSTSLSSRIASLEQHRPDPKLAEFAAMTTEQLDQRLSEILARYGVDAAGMSRDELSRLVRRCGALKA
jgi:hypothetical protein